MCDPLRVVLEKLSVMLYRFQFGREIIVYELLFRDKRVEIRIHAQQQLSVRLFGASRRRRYRTISVLRRTCIAHAVGNGCRSERERIANRGWGGSTREIGNATGAGTAKQKIGAAAGGMKLTRTSRALYTGTSDGFSTFRARSRHRVVDSDERWRLKMTEKVSRRDAGDGWQVGRRQSVWSESLERGASPRHLDIGDQRHQQESRTNQSPVIADWLVYRSRRYSNGNKG